MTANINFNVETGKHSFVDVRFAAWHHLGQIGNGTALTASEMLNQSQQNFEVTKEQMYNPITGDLIDYYSVIRTDNCDVLGVVGKDYTVIQNDFKFRVMDELIGQIDGAHYETGGVLGKGERVWAQASIGEFDLLGSGDKHNKYLLGCGSHDGSLAEQYKAVETRVVCQNTMSMALSENGRTLKAKHTKNGQSKIWNSVKLLQASKDTFQNMNEKLEFLATHKVNNEIVCNTLAKMFKIDLTKDLSKGESEKVMKVTELFESNDNDTFKEFRGTGYNLLNAITEYTDHFKAVRGAKNDTETNKQRAFNAMFGTGDTFKTESMNVVMELLKNSETINQPVAYSIPGSQELVSELLAK